MVKLIKGVNDLATLRPELVTEWHPTKNGVKTPDIFTLYSNEKAWWICSLGHEWEARIADRSQGNGCPICAGKQVLVGYNDLATVNPELASQWHPTKNGSKTPTMFTQWSHEKVWWSCPKGHEWNASIASRSTGNNCPGCDSESKTSFPEQAIYYYLKQIDNAVENRKKINDKVEVDVWIPAKNIAIEYDGRRYHVGKKSEQKEQKKNEYLKTCRIRLIRVKESLVKNSSVCITSNCIVFSIKNNYFQLGEVIEELIKMVFDNIQQHVDLHRDRISILELYKQNCLNNSLASLHPQLVKEWHPTKNGNLTPEMFTAFSHEKVWWKCPKGHVWRAMIAKRSLGRGCPICSGNNVLNGHTDLTTTNPELAKQWHPTKNGDKTPYMFTQWSNVTAWWICPLGHEWETTIANRSKGNGCPICSGHQVLVGYNDLATLQPELASQWHSTKNGNLTPQMVTQSSGKKTWWICPLGHEWEATIDNRSHGNGCPVCSGHRVLSGYNDLSTTHPTLASEWHPTKNGTLTPEMFSKGSHQKAWWKCPCGHEWSDTITHRSSGRVCALCAKINHSKNKC